MVTYSTIVSADPDCSNLGSLFYIGTDGTNSFWLSISSARIKEAKLQGPASQIVDDFTMFPNELHLSASPFIGLGPNGQHSLFNIKNNGPCLIDSDRQTFDPPEFPGLPESPGGGVPDGGFGGSPGSNVLSQILLNVNKNFLSTYLLRTYSVTDRVDNAFFRCEEDYWDQKWQVWVEPRYVGINSRVATGNPSANSRNLQIGASYNLNQMFLVGLSMVGNNNNVNAFSGNLVNKSQGVLGGPYLGLKIDSVILDAWLIYGYSDINSRLLGLKGDFFMNSLMASGNASVLFNICGYELQPKLSAFYSHNKTSKFSYAGVIPNRNVSVTLKVGEDKFDYANVSLTTKLLRQINLCDMVLIPSITAGINDNFVLPDHGHVLNRRQQTTSISKWSGIAKAGIGVKFYEPLRLDLLAGYYSIGVKEDLWDVGLTLTLGL